MTVLVLGIEQQAALVALRARASNEILDAREVMAAVKTREGDAIHRRRMEKLTIEIPAAYVVTFSIERQPTVGLCRHASVSVRRSCRAPGPQAVWQIAKELGFRGSLTDCRIWPELLQDGRVAANLVQPLQPAEQPA